MECENKVGWKKSTKDFLSELQKGNIISICANPIFDLDYFFLGLGKKMKTAIALHQQAQTSSLHNLYHKIYDILLPKKMCHTQTSTVAYLGRLDFNLFPFSKVLEQKQSKRGRIFVKKVCQYQAKNITTRRASTHRAASKSLRYT